nr:hypothetical protein [Tanacetum cinerariifolium]
MIGGQVLSSFCVNYLEFELLKEENPTKQSRLEIFLCKEIFEGRMIRIHNAFVQDEASTHSLKKKNGVSFSRRRVISQAIFEKSFMNRAIFGCTGSFDAYGNCHHPTPNLAITSTLALLTLIPSLEILWPRTMPSLTIK